MLYVSARILQKPNINLIVNYSQWHVLLIIFWKCASKQGKIISWFSFTFIIPSLWEYIITYRHLWVIICEDRPFKIKFKSSGVFLPIHTPIGRQFTRAVLVNRDMWGSPRGRLSPHHVEKFWNNLIITKKL